MQIWSFPFSGGNPILIDEGINPVISPNSNKIAYIKNGQLWTASIDGDGEPKKLFHSRGRNGRAAWEALISSHAGPDKWEKMQKDKNKFLMNTKI